MIKDKNLLAYSFPQKKPIFDLNYDYAVVRKISDFWWQDDSLYLEVTLSNLQKSTLKITLYSNGIINLQYYQKKINNSRFAEHLNSLNLKKIDLINHPNYFEIKLLKNEKLVIQKEPFQITLLDCNAVVKFKTNTRKGYEMFENYRTPPLGWKIGKSNEWQPFMSFWLMNDEKIYGLGEKFRFLVKNGIETTIWNSDNSCVANHDLAYNGLPLFYSTKKWGVLVNTGEQTSFEIGSPVTDAISFLSFESCLDLYFFTGSTMKELISQYIDLTGKPTEIPDLSYGIWCNRLYYHNKAELWAEIEKSNKVIFPLDVICLDPKWLENRYTKSCNFEYNENAFGSFQELFAQLKAKNIAVCFWINPYLQADNSVNWQIALKNNYLVKTTNDNSYAHPLTGTETYQTNCGIVDFTNPAAVKWYQDELQKLFKLGLRFVKPDYGDGIPPNAYFNNGLTGEEFRQYYHFLYCKTAYDASVKYFGPNKTLSFCRPGYIGTQRFSGKWSGDSYSNFTELKIHLNAGLSLGMSGEMAWGTDIGGFYSEEPFDEYLYMRWTQVGMLCPLSRFHGIGPREPWNFSARVLDNAIKYAKLKRKLLPYFKMCELEAATTGVPILRAMVLENEDDSIAQLIDDQFYLGSNLLVAPVLTPQTTKREVYLPAGEWFLFGQKEKKYLGKQSYLLVCPVDEMLIFVKGSNIIPTIKEDNYHFEQLDTVSLELNLYGTLPAQYDLKFKLNEKLIIITYQNKKFDVSSNHNYLVK